MRISPYLSPSSASIGVGGVLQTEAATVVRSSACVRNHLFGSHSPHTYTYTSARRLIIHEATVISSPSLALLIPDGMYGMSVCAVVIVVVVVLDGEKISDMEE